MSGYAGALPGALSADNSGGASYGVDIDVPPGIAGAAPKLSFSYSSLAGNGPLGWFMRRWVALGLANLANIFDPAAFVVGGGLVDMGDLLFTPLRAAFSSAAA